MIELILILLGTLVSLGIAGIMLIYSRKSPINEMKLMSFTFFAIGVFLATQIPALYLSTETDINNLALLIQRTGFFIGQLGVLGGSLSIIFPNFKSTYRSILVIIFTSGVNISSAIYNGLTVSHSIVGEYMRMEVDLVGGFLWVFSFIVFGLLIFQRITEVSRIVKNRPNPFTDIRRLSIMLLFLVPGVGIMLLTPVFPKIPSPGFLYTIPLSITLIYFIYAFSKDKAFFFITPASLDAVIITEQRSGLTIYSKNFIEGLPADQLIGGLFAALDISLQETIKAARELTGISFGDKVILLSRGQWITSLVIVSEKNFVTSAVTEFVTREFEKQYSTILPTLEDAKEGIPEQHFKDFRSINDVRYYIPL